MCGICGCWSWSGENREFERETVQNMADALAMRGPDGSGSIFLQNNGPALAHRRLAVLDTSMAGYQPMVSASGRFVITYNGEIYNHLELREELADIGSGCPVWNGTSDTETILACFETWGIHKSLERLTGMFAFAVWDGRSRVLTLARDRMGEKPLYYCAMDDVFIFASELGSIEKHPQFRGTVDGQALHDFLKYSYVPGPASIYTEVRKLMPGSYLDVAISRSDSRTFEFKGGRYWSLANAVSQGKAREYVRGDVDVVREMNAVLGKVVAAQTISDVPLGAFLSGGIDSSLVVAHMARVMGQSVKTFSIGFEDERYDESDFAQDVALYFDTDHHELIVTPERLLELVPKLVHYYSEPFADSSQLPTLLVSALAREHVTVALTGDGADEMFGGYNRYVSTGKIWRIATAVPSTFRHALSWGIDSVGKSTWQSTFDLIGPVLPRKWRVRLAGDKIKKIGRLLREEKRQDYFECLISTMANPSQYLLAGPKYRSCIVPEEANLLAGNFEEWMMFVDSSTYLPDDICTKVDRASMANSLETRAPFLDRRIVDFSWSLPLRYKIRNGVTKWVLREALAQFLPRQLFERPKMGFGIPLGSWLRGPLYEWADDLLREERLKEDGFFEAGEVRKVWRDHSVGREDHGYLIWNMVMFNAWLDASNRF